MEHDAAMRAALAFLNEHFTPWTFAGEEPVALALAALLRAQSVEAQTTSESAYFDGLRDGES